MNNTNQNRNNRNNSFLVQGSILAIAGILVRIIGLVKRIPLAHIIGDQGLGFYAIAYDVYNIVLLISCYSLPLAVSKLVSSRVSKGQYINANRIFRGALVFAVIVGGGLGAVVYFYSDIFVGVMSEPMSMLALKVLGPTILIVAVMGVLRGYFQGLGTTIPTAISQVIEQIFVAGVSITAAYFLFDYGSKIGELRMDPTSYAAAYGAAGGTTGTSVGALLALLFLIFVYAVYKNKLKKQMKRDVTNTKENYSMIFKILVITIVPVILSTAVYHISDIIDQYIFGKIMIEKGFEDIKTIQMGIYTGKYKILINIPLALASAMCASLIPSLIAAKERRDRREMQDKVTTVVRFTMIIIIPCAVGLGLIGNLIVDFLFPGSTALAAELLAIGSIATVFFALSTLGNGILQGMNKMKLPIKNALIALVIHVISLYIMLQYLDLGIYGVVISTIIFSFLMSILNYLSIRKHLNYKQEIKKTFVIPTLCASVMGFAIYLMNRFLVDVLGNDITLFLAIFIGGVIYFILLVLLRGVGQRELSKIPGGHIIIKIARNIGIMNKN